MLRSTDSVNAKLTPREAVLTRNGAEIIGRDKIRQANAFGNHLAQRGIDLPTIHAQYGNEDVTMNNPLGYDKGTDNVEGDFWSRLLDVRGFTHRELERIREEARQHAGDEAPLRFLFGGQRASPVEESAQQYRQSYGPTLSPPYAEEIPGYGVRQFTGNENLQNFPVRPYYVQPGVGVSPQPATSYGAPYERQYQGGTSDVPWQPAGWQSGNDPVYNPMGRQPAFQPAGIDFGNDPIMQQPRDDFYAGKFFGGGLVPHGHGRFGGGQDMGGGGAFGGRGGGGGRNMRMFQEGTSDVVPYWDPATGQMVTDANDPRTHIYGTNPPVAPPPPPIVNNPVTAAASKWTPEQKAVVDRIYSGREDYTFGPGSPHPSKEDLGTYVRGPHAPAAGFQQERGVALAPKEYNLFTPEQRRELGIMDIAPADQAGMIERWYGTPSAWAGGGGDPGMTQRANPMQGSFAQIQNGVYSMDPQGDYAKATAGTSPEGPSKFGEGVGSFGKALSGISQAYGKEADKATERATSQALSMIGGISGNAYSESPLAAYYAALQNPTVFGRGG